MKIVVIGGTAYRFKGRRKAEGARLLGCRSRANATTAFNVSETTLIPAVMRNSDRRVSKTGLAR
jgi:hypothetical protein